MTTTQNNKTTFADFTRSPIDCLGLREDTLASAKKAGIVDVLGLASAEGSFPIHQMLDIEEALDRFEVTPILVVVSGTSDSDEQQEAEYAEAFATGL